MKTFLALLRGINVTGRNRVPMAELRSLCDGLGWVDVRTYIQSGNVVFRAAGTAVALQTELEAGINRRFGLDIAVLVRTPRQWAEYAHTNPFPDAARDTPNLLLLALSRSPLAAGAVAALQQRAANDERVAEAGGALWLYLAGGAGRSKMTPALLDRVAGSPVTMRNWRTVVALDALLQDR
jgi:uncharacterized protein (DUF1697 family)